MKTLSLGIVILMLFVSNVFAAAFAPEVMKLSAPASVYYAFDGKALEIPVTLSGVGGATSLLIFTKDKGATISNITNGFMGWHHVNKIDTCLYVSPFTQLAKGTTPVAWDGKDENGAAVPSGEYTYYIWSFDNVNPRIQMTKHMSFSPWSFRTILTHDTAGNKLANPIIYTAEENWSAETTLGPRMKFKWTIGGDPADDTLRETCSVMQTQDHGGIAFDPLDHSKFWVCYQANNGSFDVKKFSWVPNGSATQDEADLAWGEGGKISYTASNAPGTQWGPGLATDGLGYLFATNSDPYPPSTTISDLIFIDIGDGTILKRLDLSPWWVDLQDGEAGGQATGGPSEFYFLHGALALGSHSTCINQLINTTYENESDAVMWTNGNGDIVGDHNWETDAKYKWVCNDYNVGPYKYNITMDDNLFAMFPSFDMGAVSFGLYAPDGTGIGYMQLAGETASQKFGIEVIDYGSNYDGIYTTNNMGYSGTDLDTSMWYVGHDSIRGIISEKVGVKEAAPVSFTVAQNRPNPFNPATTISFTLAKAGKTTVEVYNVAGQKVGTLVNGALSAGSHSVVWNASNASAGIYFYTVRSGDFSRTMKMTLLK